MNGSTTTELAKRLLSGTRDAIANLEFGPQEGFITLEPHSGAYSIGPDEQFWGGFMLGRGWLLADLFEDHLLTAALKKRAKHVELLMPIPNVDTGFAGFFGLAMGFELTGDTAMKEAALVGARSVARLYDTELGVFVTRPTDVVDDDFMKLPFSDVFCERELLVDSGAILDLMWWASRYEESYRAMLMSHFHKCIEYGVVDNEGQSHHALSFDPQGNPIKLHTHQGYQEASRWTRAQAWAALGYATAFAATGDEKFGEIAIKSTQKLLDALDGRLVGPYDLDTPDPLAPEDSCSTAITMAGIARLESVGMDVPEQFRSFKDAALAELLKRYVTPGGTLLHGCWGTLGKAPRPAVMPYGNYFLAETVYRALAPNQDAWGLTFSREIAR